MVILTLAEKAALIGPLDYVILKTIYKNSSNYGYIPYSVLLEESGLLNKELDETLTKLYNLRLISKEKVTNKIGYRLTFSGLDILAIKKLYTDKILKSLGIVIGEGKESNVYFGYNFSDDTVIVKFHRVGKTSYKNIRKIRGITYKKNWIEITVENAEREYEALKCVSDNYGFVPKPYGYAYNAVVMEYIQGNELYRTSLSDPGSILQEILSTIRIAYNYCNKIVHGDLSEYNVIVNEEGKAYVIDWPQWQRGNEDLLLRDLTNILYYFTKKYDIYKSLDDVINYIKGK